jgi:hypothetical protein
MPGLLLRSDIALRADERKKERTDGCARVIFAFMIELS